MNKLINENVLQYVPREFTVLNVTINNFRYTVEQTDVTETSDMT
jgi:hypothetical protein